MHYIFVVSDGTGGTAKQTLKAALTQFAGAQVKIKRRAEIRSREQVRQVIEEAVARQGLIVHTLVSDDLRQGLLDMCRLRDVETIDLMGPLLAQLAVHLSNEPSEEPGLYRKLNEAYFRRIESMEYAFRHDDGQRLHELSKAEIVLVGVSRTFKTPLSIYFAFKGWFVANVPIVLNMPVPPILFDLPPGRVVGLTTDPYRLAALRRVRHEHLGGSTGQYAEVDYVREEIRYALRTFRSSTPQWPIVDVTNKPIEEIASEILAMLRRLKSKEESLAQKELFTT